jgi:Kef-type K+ transport system membrane component KefB
MEPAIFILIVFVLARVCGRAAERLHQPSSVGEVAAGAVLAVVLAQPFPPAAADWIVHTEGPLLSGVAEAGIFLLLLRAGVEMEPSEILQNSRRALIVAIGTTFSGEALATTGALALVAAIALFVLVMGLVGVYLARKEA